MRCFLQWTHVLRIFLIALLAFTIQNCSLRSDRTCSTPQCLFVSWRFRIKIVLIWWFFGNIIGLIASADIGAFDILPPTRMIPSPFKIGLSLIILLEAFTCFPLFRLVTSSGKLVFCITATILLFALSRSSQLISPFTLITSGSRFCATRHFIQSRNLSNQATFRKVCTQLEDSVIKSSTVVVGSRLVFIVFVVFINNSNAEFTKMPLPRK